MRAIAGSLVAVERKIVQAFKHGKSDPLAALGEFLAAAETAGQQLARTPPATPPYATPTILPSPRFHDDPRGEARPVDVTAARAGGGGGICAHAQARRAQGVESALYEFTRRTIRYQGQLRHQAHAQGWPRRAARRGAHLLWRHRGHPLRGPAPCCFLRRWFVGVLVLMVYSIFVMTLYLLTPQAR